MLQVDTTSKMTYSEHQHNIAEEESYCELGRSHHHLDLPVGSAPLLTASVLTTIKGGNPRHEPVNFWFASLIP